MNWKGDTEESSVHWGSKPEDNVWGTRGEKGKQTRILSCHKRTSEKRGKIPWGEGSLGGGIMRWRAENSTKGVFLKEYARAENWEGDG